MTEEPEPFWLPSEAQKLSERELRKPEGLSEPLTERVSPGYERSDDSDDRYETKIQTGDDPGAQDVANMLPDSIKPRSPIG